VTSPKGTVLRTTDGRDVLLRDLAVSDEPALRRAFEAADQGVLRARFGGGIPPFSVLAERLRRLDGVARYAVGVFDEAGDVIAVGEYAQAAPDGPAEVALVVHHAWQRCGIGTALLTRLAEHAVGVGITTATAQVSGSNEQVLELVQAIPAPHTVSYDHGVGTVLVQLPHLARHGRTSRTHPR
jgi:GNAT superfamily N-acetyltransferase